jgi:hypothetical protein
MEKLYLVTRKLNFLLLGFAVFVVLFMSSTKIGTANVGIQYATYSQTFPETGSGWAQANCESGWFVTGGGFLVPQNNIVTQSRPVTAGPQYGWIVSAHELKADGIPNEIQVYAICEKNFIN